MRTSSRYWRGALVILVWVLWPPIFWGAQLIIHLERSTGRGCSLEGCEYPLALTDLFVLIPPAIATILWWRWRRARARDARTSITAGLPNGR